MRRPSLRVLWLVVGVSALALVVAHAGPAALAGHLVGLGWAFPAILAVQLASFMCDALALRRCVGAGARALPFVPFARALLCGQAVNAVTPGNKLGELTKHDLLAGALPRGAAAGALVLQNLVAAAAGCAVIAVAGPVALVCLPITGTPAVLLGAASAGALVVLVALALLSTRGLGALSRIAAPAASWVPGWLRAGAARAVVAAHAASRRPLDLAAACLAAVAARLLSLAETAIILHRLNGQHGAGGHGAAVALAAQAGSVAVQWATAFVPMQVGTAEAGGFALFAALGLSPGTGVALELVRRARRLVFAAAGFVLLAWTTRRRASAMGTPGHPRQNVFLAPEVGEKTLPSSP